MTSSQRRSKVRASVLTVTLAAAILATAAQTANASAGPATRSAAGHPAAGQPANAALTDTLPAGQPLIALSGSHELSSRSGEFTFDSYPEEVVLDQFAPLSGPDGQTTTATDVWIADDSSGNYPWSNTDRSTLRMQTDGNLVLYTSTGRVLWQSRTAGTGSHNRLVMQNDGNLVMYTSTNKAIWATSTTPVYLPAGRRLPSGARMVDRSGVPVGGPTSSLSMQKDGNLVYRCDGSPIWATNTHVPGSFLSMQRDGNLVLTTATGHPLWSTRTTGAGPYTWLDSRRAAVFQASMITKQLWQAEFPYSSAC
jgi:hypothetical protein